jgi:iron(III) transport system permease protein
LAAVAVAGVLLLCGAPLANLIVKAGTQPGPTAGWSGAQLAATMAEVGRRYSEEFQWSLIVAATASLLTVVLAAPLAWRARRGRAAMIVPLLAGALLALPAPLLGVGIARFFSLAPQPLNFLYRYSILGPVLAQSLRIAPVVLLICWHAFRALPQSSVDSAALEAPTRWRRWSGVLLPLTARYLAAAVLAGVAISFGELAATVLVAPPGLRLFATTLFGLIHFGVRDAEAGVCLAALALQWALALGVIALVTPRSPADSVGPPAEPNEPNLP